MSVRVIFMGTPPLARTCLEALLAAPDNIVAAVTTQPDRPKGRDLKLQPSPVKELALQSGIPVLQPERARSETFIDELRRLQPDLIAVAAYGQILPQVILDLPRYGCLNVHTSLLPRYRGAAPIQWAILNGDSETGITIMKMDAGMDTGDILTQERTAITETDDAQTLHDRLANMGATLLVKTIPDFIAGKIIPHPQSSEGVVPAPKIKKQDGLIDWNLPAHSIWNRIRGSVPWPGTFTNLTINANAERLKIWEARPESQNGAVGEILHADKSGILVGCGSGSVRILQVQREGGKRLSAAQFLAGHPLSVGERFS